MRRARLMAVAAGVLVACGVLSGAALAVVSVTYEGPKTWLPGYDGEGSYDTSASRWYWNSMTDKSCWCWSRVTFINSGGGWTYTTTSQGYSTYTSIPAGSDNYQKKPYCTNNDAVSYTAKCYADRA